MRFTRLVRATAESEAAVVPPQSLFDEMARYHEALAEAGVLLDVAGLKPARERFRIRHGAGKRTVVDGPFAESEEPRATP